MKYMRQAVRSLTVLLMMMISFSSRAQTGNIRGHILSNDGKPIPGVTISIKGTQKTIVSGDDGKFELEKIKAGKQVLIISAAGMRTEEKMIVVLARQTVSADIGLSVNAVNLDEVIINSHRNINARTISSAKSQITNMDLPQTVGAVSSKVISDQQATRVGEVIRNISGVSLTQTRLGVNETYTARGYSIGINGASGSVLKNGLISNTAGMPEAATLESVEVMKGSTALLYGNVSGGLVLNLVTKKPQFDHGGELKMQAGTYAQYKPIVDIYGPISRDLAFRIVGTYENDKSFRDLVHTKRIYVDPSLLYKIGKRTSILLEGDHLDGRSTPDFGIGALDSGRVLPVNIPISRFINVAWAYNHVKQSGGTVQLKHSMNDDWNIDLSAAIQQTKVDSYGAGLPNVVSRTGDWNRTLARAQTLERNISAQANLHGKFITGKIPHQLLFGADITRLVTNTNAYRITSNGTVVTNYDKINILDPSLYNQRTDIPDATLITETKAPVNRMGIYLQNLSGLNKKIKIMTGLRWSGQKTFQTNIFSVINQTNSRGTAASAFYSAFSTKLALVYQPVKTSSVFASYSNNFTINSGTDIYGQQLKPSMVDQYEIGIKNDLLKGRLTANFSIYRIINSNLAQQAEFRADGTVNTDATVRELKGQTTSDGLEVELNGNFSSNFYFIAGYGYNDMRFTRTTGAKGSNIEGERLVNNPRHTANFATFYTFQKGRIKGLRLGIAAFYTGRRLGGYNNTVGQTQLGSRLLPLSDFTTVDISAGYGFKSFLLQCRVSNIFNTVNYLVHDNYSIAPIAPTQFTATLTYKLWNSDK